AIRMRMDEINGKAPGSRGFFVGLESTGSFPPSPLRGGIEGGVRQWATKRPPPRPSPQGGGGAEAAMALRPAHGSRPWAAVVGGETGSQSHGGNGAEGSVFSG